MRIQISGVEIQLDSQEVKSAKKMTLEYLNRIKIEAQAVGQPTYYFTTLIVMHLLSQELIDEMDSKSLEMILNRINNKKNPK